MAGAPFTFISFNRIPRCTAWVDRYFPDYFALNYSHGGDLWWAPKGQPLRLLREPVAWVTWPGSSFIYGQKEAPGWNHRFVTFRGLWADELATRQWIPTDPAAALRPVADPARFCARFDAVLAALEGGAEDEAWARLLVLLVSFRHAESSKAAASPGATKARALAAEIGASPAAAYPEQACARRCGLSASQFRRVFRAITGTSLRQYHLRERMRLAGSLLRTTDLPLRAISETCGIAEETYFWRLFRNRFAMTPGEYRRASNPAKDTAPISAH